MNYKSLLIATIFPALPVSATTITFNLANPAGDVGSYTHTYTSSPAGFTITAYGYTNGNPNRLYGKTGSGDEYGLGLTGTSDFEISSNDAVILDISQLASFQSLELEIGSVQSGETYNVLGGDSLNSVTTQLIMAGTLDNVYFSVPHFSNYKYLAVTAPPATSS